MSFYFKSSYFGHVIMNLVVKQQDLVDKFKNISDRLHEKSDWIKKYYPSTEYDQEICKFLEIVEEKLTDLQTDSERIIPLEHLKLYINVSEKFNNILEGWKEEHTP